MACKLDASLLLNPSSYILVMIKFILYPWSFFKQYFPGEVGDDREYNPMKKVKPRNTDRVSRSKIQQVPSSPPKQNKHFPSLVVDVVWL